MQKKLLHKLLAIGILSLLLLIPLSMIESQIAARSARQADVTKNIAESAAGAQIIVGPVISVRYRERIERRTREEGSGRETTSHEVVERTRVFPLQRLDIGGDLRVDSLSRGLYRARLYHLAAQVSGNGSVPPRLGLDKADLVDARATLVLGISDPRGVEDDPEVRVNGVAHRLVTGTAGGLGGQGAHVPLGEFDPLAGATYEFAMPLNLTGLEQLAIAPTANATRVTLKSPWPHPSFQGRFLPQTRSVTKEGFEATWQVSHLARNFDRAIKAGEGSGTGETLGVGLIDPGERLSQVGAGREVRHPVRGADIRRILPHRDPAATADPPHAVPAGRAGAGDFLPAAGEFGMSEHLDFMAAYAISSTACVALIGTYLAGALGSRLRGAASGAGIAALYGVLYGVLASEDNALLMGTLLLFLALGTTMLTTRKLDWYRVAPLAADERG